MSDGQTDRCWVPESDLSKVVGVRDELLNVRYRYMCKYRYHINRILPLKIPYIKVANWHIASQIKRICLWKFANYRIFQRITGEGRLFVCVLIF